MFRKEVDHLYFTSDTLDSLFEHFEVSNATDLVFM